MPPSTQQSSTQPGRIRHLFSLLGLLVGFAAVGVAVFEPHLSAQTPVKEDTRTLGELANEAGKRLLKENVLKEAPPPPAPLPFPPLRITYTMLGLVAMGLGTCSWIKKEHIRMSGASISLGLLAVAWPWVLIGIATAVVILILANLYA